MERLMELKIAIEQSVAISKADKEYIKKEYLRVIGTALSLKECSCTWHDAIVLILVKLNSGKVSMRGGAVVNYNGAIYTKHNITEEVARAVIEQQPETKIYFLNL